MSHNRVNSRYPSRSRFVENTTSMYCLQLVNYGLPLVSVPYLIATLGSDKYGIMVGAQALMFNFVFLVDAGFNTRAVRELSNPTISRQRIELVFLATQLIKFGLILTSFIILMILFATDVLVENTDVVLASSLLMMGSLLFPTWLFQGLEVMRHTLVCSAIGRSLAFAGILVWVKSSDDLLRATLFQSSATVMSGLISICFFSRMQTTIDRSLLKTLTAEVISSVKDVRTLAVSEFVNATVSNGGVFILSLFATDIAVGVYAALEKLARAVMNLFQPLLKVLYPRVASLWQAGRQARYQQEISMWIKSLLSSAAVVLGLLSCAAPHVLDLLFGTEWIRHSYLLRSLCGWVFFAIATAMLGQLVFLARGQLRLYSQVAITTGLIQLCLALAGAKYYGINGLIAALVFAESMKFVILFSNYKFS